MTDDAPCPAGQDWVECPTCREIHDGECPATSMPRFTAELYRRGESVSQKAPRGADNLVILDGPPEGRQIIIPAHSLKEAAVLLQQRVGGVIEYTHGCGKGGCGIKAAWVFTDIGKWVVR